MSITITDGSDTVTLTDDLQWVDEFSFNPVRETKEISVTGAIILQLGTLVAGREITLKSPDDRSGWVPYSAVAQLQEWKLIAGQELTLTVRSVPYTVVFRHADGALEVTPVVDYSDYNSTDWCLITLRFMVTE